MTLSRTSREVGLALRADGRRRALVDRLRQLLHTIEPQVATSPHKRRRLREVIDELAAAGEVSLPRGRAQYDRLEQPPLPRFVVVEGLPEPASRRAVGAQTHPWLPELSWAASLRPPLRVDEMEALLRVSAFLAAGPGREMPVVPLQERSLAIFGDEKRLGEMAGQRLFAPGRLSFPLLACREVHPPFVHKQLSTLPTMLVVENSATYDTLLRVLDASGPIGCLAYGAGKHFIGSVSAAGDLVPVPARILYFGDMDPDGLMIPAKASDTASAHRLPAVEPAHVLYDLLFGFAPEPDGDGPDRTVGEDARASWLPERWRGRAAELLRGSRRLAQEHVGLELLQGDRGWIEGLKRQLAAPAVGSERSAAGPNGASSASGRPTGARMIPVNDPHEPIVAHLTRPREEPRSVSRSESGWTAISGGHVPARPDTIRFVRERFVDDHGLVAVEYEDADGRAWFMTFGVIRSGTEDWRMTGAAGGGRSGPGSSVPWANLGCWWGDRVFCAGGRVHGAEVRKVRIVAAGGETADDDIGESGVALVLAVGPFPQPWTVELYDAAGGLLRSHPFVGGRAGAAGI